MHGIDAQGTCARRKKLIVPNINVQILMFDSCV